MGPYDHPDRNPSNNTHPIERPVFSAKYDAAKLPQAIVSLKFMKGGNPQGGTGFFVNIPGAKKKFILTAGHNLISEKLHTEMKIQLFNEEFIDIPNENFRINSIYAATPNECSAEHDYGVILLPEGRNPPGDFGFSLPLSVAKRFDCQLSVTGFTTANNKTVLVTSSGSAVNPIMRQNQLEYMIETEGGLSGSPVWVGYKRHPTVVAIHNYGPKIKKPGYGSRGTRINLKSLRDIFEWIGVDTTDKILRSSKQKEPVKPPLRLSCSADDNAFRIVVDELDDPLDTMLMSIFPVYAAPSREVTTHPAFGFLQKDRWVSWDVPSTASLVDDLRRAWLGRIEIPGKYEGWEYQQGKPFAIVVPPRRSGTMQDGAQVEDQVLTVEHHKAKGWRLEEAGEILDLIGYREHVQGKQFKDAHNRWVLEIPVLG